MVQPTAQPQTKSLTPVDEVKGSLQRMEGEFAVVLPKHIPSEKFIRVAQTAIAMRPELAQADRRGLYAELMKCAQDGLVPDGREAVINVFNNKAGGKDAKYIPMVGGICKKARNSGEIASIDSQVVYQEDEYKAWVDETGPHFKHVRARGNRGTPFLTYAYVITKDGGFYFEEVDEQQMQAIEASSRPKEQSPWKGPFKDEMRRKSALHRLLKYRAPSSADLEQVIERDADLYEKEPEQSEQPAKEPETRPSRLGKLVGDQVQNAEVVPAKAPAPATPPPAAPKAAAPAPRPATPPPAEDMPNDAQDEVPI